MKTLASTAPLSSVAFADKKNAVKMIPLLASFTLGVAIWLSPVPGGLSLQAWHLFAIFVATIFAVVMKPLPMGGVALLALAMVVGTKTLTLDQSLSSFSSPVVWLVVFAFFISRGFMKTGLGKRLAYILVSQFGHSSLGLGYAVTLSDFLLAPAIPSNTARGAGIVFPIVKSLAQALGSDPEKKTEKKLGGYLIKVAFQANVISSAMFVTAMAGNPMIVGFAKDLDLTLSWGTWALAALVPGILSLILLPILMMIIYPPQLKKTPNAPLMARKSLEEMGPLRSQEKIMLATFLGLLILWGGATYFDLEATTTALLGFAILIVTGVLEWSDVMDEKAAWETLIWFATLLMMASFLGKLGMIKWFSQEMQFVVQGVHWTWAVGFLSLVYFYSHYLFASATAHVSSMFSAFLVVMLASGAPPLPATFLMAFLSSLSAGLTHYGTGTAPVFFGAGYVLVTDWWRIGAIFSVANIIIWVFAGGGWWYVLGHWG